MILQVTLIDKNKGFTLLEVLIVIAITLIIASISIPLYGALQQSAQLNDSVSGLVQAVRVAYQRSAAGFNDSNHGVYFDIDPSGPDSYIIYQGDSYATRDSSHDWEMVLPDAVDMTTTITGNEVNFSNGLAVPDNVGTVTINHITGSQQRELEINSEGYVEEN